MKISKILLVTLALVSLSLAACSRRDPEGEGENKIVATSPMVTEVDVKEPYVCQIHAQKYIQVKAMATGYLDDIKVKEGQSVRGPVGKPGDANYKPGELMFKIRPVLYRARYEAEAAEAKLAGLELDYTRKLYYDKVVSQNEVSLYEAKLKKAKAKAELAKKELEFTDVYAPFDGIVDRLKMQLGSLVKEEMELTTLSDTSVMWVYFNVPERRYLEIPEIKARQGKGAPKSQIIKLHDAWVELKLADGKTFEFNKNTDEKIDTVTLEAEFNNETGTVPFRADFPNPDRLLRHGQTGNVVIHRRMKNAVVIPQRATFEVLQKQYVYVIDKDNEVHQREIVIQNEQEDLYVLKPREVIKPEDPHKKEYVVGLAPDERFILEGVRQVQDGVTREYEYVPPEKVMKKLKYHAE